MTRAGRMHSMPPIRTPIDTTRRNFIAQAAVAAAGGAALGMALPLPVSAGAPERAPDPVFGLIAGHRRAHIAHLKALKLQSRFERLYRDYDRAAEISEKPCHDEDDVFEALIATPATTLPGCSLGWLTSKSWIASSRPNG